MRFKNELEIDVGRCINSVLHKKRFIALMGILFMIAGFGYTLNPGSDLYTSRATVYAAANGSYSESSTAVTAMNAYLDVARSYKVSQRAALLIGREDIDASTIMSSVYVSASIDTSKSTISNYLASTATTISITATTTDPALSIEMANAVADAYVLEMENILSTDAIKPLDSAYSYSKTRNAKMRAWKIRLMALLVGIFVGIAVVVFFEIFDKKVRTIREGSIRGELPILGVIPDYKE